MTIFFTETEKKYLEIKSGSDYKLSYKEDTPKQIADSIQQKIDSHKQWIAQNTGHDMKERGV